MTSPIQFRKFAAAAATAALLTAGLTALPGSAQAEWRGWNIHVPDYPVSLGMDQFTAEIAEKSGGKLTAKTYHSGVLGSQPDAIEQMRLGSIDYAVFNLGPMGQVIPATNVVSLPFIFKGMDHMHRVLDGPVGEQLSDAMAEKGIVALAWYDSGARSFYNSKKPIMTPDDVKGMKVRVMNNDLFVNMVASMGGNATPMAFSEVYSSIKTGVVDGAENNWPSYESSRHFEVARHYSETRHVMAPEVLVASQRSWDRMSGEEQGYLQAAADDSVPIMREMWDARVDASRQRVLDDGIQLVADVDHAAFAELMLPVWDRFLLTPKLRALADDIVNLEVADG